MISDVKLPDINGIELTQQIKANWPATEIIVLTAFGTINDGVKAIKSGAFDYITKGDDNEKIIPLVSKAMDKALLQQRVLELENKLNDKFGFDRIIGNSAAITDVIKLAQKVALTDTTVLLLGETGTGKEIFAEAIHQASNRKAKSFVAVNCSAFTKELLESELFGHKAGAFTGAVKDKKGLFEEANGGTIFLDEIGELDHELQAKLLRVLESQQFIKDRRYQTYTCKCAHTGRHQPQPAGRIAKKGISAPICFTAYLFSRSPCLHCASVKKTSAYWLNILCNTLH